MSKVRFEITKGEEIRYISHLDYAGAIERAIRRAKLPAAYSEGFNPHMKLAFASALAVGVTSDAEYMDVEFITPVVLTDTVNKLCRVLPRGIEIKKATVVNKQAPKLMAVVNMATYIVKMPLAKVSSLEDVIASVKAFNAKDSLSYIKASPKGNKEIDAKEYVKEINLKHSDNIVELSFSVAIKPTGSIKPGEVLDALTKSFIVSIDQSEALIYRTGLYIVSDNAVITPLDIGEERLWIKE